MSDRPVTGRTRRLPGEAAPDAEAGLRRLEGYLYWQTQSRLARQAAKDFTELLPWLTDGQRADVEEHFTRIHTAATRQRLEQFREERDRLRAQYHDRYLRLRNRCVLAGLLTTGAAWALLALAVARH
ncbi:hypothetical protein [Kitasatospora phosalacinea]|uniref:hypothetical protein n=1 Tax=Kitasatospora phosalacinea TaxID=2065 RepID=UPI00068EFE9C|nr:hypothetical protein [Kitasatospora phosalacinea]